MERPQHELAAIAAQGGKHKTTGLGIVIGIHALIITALIIGLSNNQIIKTAVDITAAVIAKKTSIEQLPPPPVQLVKPVTNVAPPVPKIEIATPPKPVVAPTEPVRVAMLPPTSPKEIARTHTLPPYPPLSQRMGEQGTTGLTCKIGADGKPVDCSVTSSSGSPRLDEAALSYVKEHYTWQPATRDGKPVADTVQLNIVWDLKNAA